MFPGTRGEEKIYLKGPFARRCSSRRRRRPAGGVRSAGPAMPWRGGEGGSGGLAWRSLGSTRAMSAPGHRLQPPFPFAASLGGPSGPLGVRGAGAQGAVRGGLAAGTRGRRQLQREGIAAHFPDPVPASSSPAPLPGTAQPLGAGELLRLFEMCPHVRGAAVYNRGRRERFALLPGMECWLFLPRSIPPSRRSPQAHLGASLAGTEVFTFLWVWHPWMGLTLRKERFEFYAFIILMSSRSEFPVSESTGVLAGAQKGDEFPFKPFIPGHNLDGVRSVRASAPCWPHPWQGSAGVIFHPCCNSTGSSGVTPRVN